MDIKKALTYSTSTVAFYTSLCCLMHVSRIKMCSLSITTIIIYSLTLYVRNCIQHKKVNEPFMLSLALSFFIASLEFLGLLLATQLLANNNIIMLLFVILAGYCMFLVQTKTDFTMLTITILLAMVFIAVIVIKLESVEKTQVFFENYDIERYYFSSVHQECVMLFFTILMRLLISNVYKNTYRYKPLCVLTITLFYGALNYKWLLKEVATLRTTLAYSIVGYLSLIYFVWFHMADDISNALCGLSGFIVCVFSLLNVCNVLFVKTRFEMLLDNIYYWVLLSYPLVFVLYLGWDNAYSHPIVSSTNGQRRNINARNGTTGNQNVNNATATTNENAGPVNEAPTEVVNVE